MRRDCSLLLAEVDVSVQRLLRTLVRRARTPRTLGLAAACASIGCGGHASPDDCARMLDRYVDLAVHEAPGSATMSPAQTAAVRDVEQGLKRAEPSYRRVQDRCASVTRSEARCALGANATAEWEACMRVAHPDAGE